MTLETLVAAGACLLTLHLVFRYVPSPLDAPLLCLLGAAASSYGYAWSGLACTLTGALVVYPLGLYVMYEKLRQPSEVSFTLEDGALEPTRGTSGSAGYDLYSSEPEVVLRPGQRRVVRTGVIMRGMASHTVAIIKSRSGMAVKGLDACAGVIDSDYEGPIGVVLHNTSGVSHTIHRGDRVAQMCFMRLANVSIPEPPAAGRRRGAGGFGSTGA